MQSCHSIADFAAEFPEAFADWKEQSNSIITLGCSNEQKLLRLYDKLKRKGYNVSLFYEPDIDGYTSLCFYADSEEARREVRNYQLVGTKQGSLDTLILDMKKTPQTDSQSVWEHGQAVSEKYHDLLSYLKGEELKGDWKLPSWLEDNKQFILDSLYCDEIMDNYHLYHDCGKPYCLEYDEDGRKHFPDHAQVSHDTYLSTFPQTDQNKLIAELILHDMDVHLMKAADLEEFYKLGKRMCISLLVTALCELHANCEMFGGTESTSFKIKNKQITKRGNAIIKNFKQQ